MFFKKRFESERENCWLIDTFNSIVNQKLSEKKTKL